MKPQILIVDDSLTVRMDLGEAFEAEYATTLCATLGEARKALGTEKFDLAILDVLLPDGDGVEFLQEIKSNPATAGIPVMLLSSEAEVRDRVRGLNTGAEEYVGKPYEQAHVLARARELLRGHGLDGDQETAAKRRTVLVIDDSATFREELRSRLETAGYRVVTAVTGEDGLLAAVDARPALIIVDGQLPGIDGATVIRRVRADAALRSTPCILLTASEEQKGGELRALEAGADAYLRKEADARGVLARVAAVLRGASGSAGPSTGMTAATSLLAPKRILTVLADLHELAALLRADGYDVVPAGTGEEALQLLAVQSVDCILLGLASPGISGKDTCRRIKGTAAWRNIPLILYADDEGAAIEAIDAGADDFIGSSDDLELLRARVRAQLRRKQFEEENRNIREQILEKELAVATANAARELGEARAAFVKELEGKNRELEAFSYTVSHDLRAPLRSVDGFSRLLLEESGERLGARGQDYLRRVRESAERMGELIDDLLELSRVGRAVLRREAINLATAARAVAEKLRERDPERGVEMRVPENIAADGDARLLRIALENLMGNAWKFTARTKEAWIEVGTQDSEEGAVYFVRDNGAGFEMSYADKLFRPFERLHADEEFAGTGIGLATVRRIVERHGGRVWAEGAEQRGAAFYFTLPAEKRSGERPVQAAKIEAGQG